MFNCQKGLDLEICRSLKKRSLLGVNEHFSDKQSFEDSPLSQLNLVVDIHSLQSSTQTIVANYNV